MHSRGLAVAIGTGARKTAFQVEQLYLAAMNRLVVSPLSKVEVMAVVQTEGRIASNDLSGHICLVEAVFGRHLIIVSNAIVSPRATDSTRNGPILHVRLGNPSPESVLLHKGTKIAQISLIMDSEVISGVSQQRSCNDNELSADAKQILWEMVENSGEILDESQQQ